MADTVRGTRSDEELRRKKQGAQDEGKYSWDSAAFERGPIIGVLQDIDRSK
jgi:hypothetical protein